MRGWVIGTIGVVALVGAGLWLMKDDEAQAEQGPGFSFVLPVTLTKIERDTLRPRTELTGSVRAARRARLAFEVEGILAQLEVDEGDVVEEGVLLASLTSGDERHELALAEAALALAQREHELLQAGERDEEKRRLQAEYEAAKADADLAQLEVERGNKLLADGILSQSEQDALRLESQASNRRRDASEEALAKAMAGTRLEDLAIAQARVDEASARVTVAQHNLKKTDLRAPWRGAIVARSASTGDYIPTGMSVFELVDPDHLEVHFEIPGRHASRLGPRSRVTLRAPGGEAVDTELDATIQAADELARGFRSIARLTAEEAARAALKPGMFCTGVLAFEPLVDVLCLPADAVMASEQGSYVVRALQKPGDAASGGRPTLVAELVPVSVLALSDARAAVADLVAGDGAGAPTAPLAEGDTIVLTGADNAFPGAPLLPRGGPGQEAGPGGGPPAAPIGAPGGSDDEDGGSVAAGEAR